MSRSRSPLFSLAISNPHNLEAALDFMDLAVNQGRPEEGVRRYVGRDFIEHDPGAPSGKDAFIKFMTDFKSAFPATNVEPKRGAADGDLVFLHGELTGCHLAEADAEAGVESYSIVDIFRFEDDKILEHWTAIQAIPAAAANENGAV